MLSKEEILSITDKATKEIEIPEWNGSVYVKGMTFEDQDYISSLGEDNNQNQKLLIKFVCDADGNPLFTEEDIPALKKKSVQAFKRIIKEVTSFNSMDEAEKNS
jgi:hypothetical protein